MIKFLRIFKTLILIVLILGRKRPKGWKSLIYNSVKSHLKLPKNLMMPVHVSIEPSNTCNAQCPVCETGNNGMKRQVGRLDFENFKKLIDRIYKHTNTLFYYFMGEPFLNKHSYEMIRYARDKGIYVETCTNGDLVNPEKLLDSGINKISFQIGGMDQKTHEIYRVNSFLNKIEKNLRELIDLKKSHKNGKDLHIELGFIVMRHNESQVDSFIQWAKELKVDTYNVINPCVRNMLEGHAYLPKNKKYWFYDEEAYNNGILKPNHVPNNECIWIWNSIQINWNGDVVPCCRDTNGEYVFGNIFKNDFDKVWNGKEALNFRKRILENQNKLDLCSLCSGYGVPNMQ